MKPVYKPGTTLIQIIADGWARGFKPTQTLQEATAQGYTTSLDEIKAIWVLEDVKMRMYFQGHPYEKKLNIEPCVDFNWEDK